MEKPTAAVPASKPAFVDEIKSVWISYLEMEYMLKGQGESGFRRNITNAFDNVKNYGLNTVVIQVRPFADALYESEYFPWSYLVTGTEGEDPGFDPFGIMVSEAKKRGLRIEAWVNPYRVRPANKTEALSNDNQAQIWLGSKDDSVIKYDGIISYNPASSKAQDLIVNGIREIVRNYDVDAVHIDDYFYPTTAAGFDQKSYNAYTNSGGKLALDDWRRANVEILIKKIYAGVKSENSGVLFGISPQSSVGNNYGAQYLDVAKIVSTTGYCDYVCPQIYFGFENGTQPFAKTLDEWDNMIKTSKIDLYVGLAVYKTGLVDTWAGAGKTEWQDNRDMLAKMVEYSREKSRYKGFVLYRYEQMFMPAVNVRGHVQAEADNLKKVM